MCLTVMGGDAFSDRVIYSFLEVEAVWTQSCSLGGGGGVIGFKYLL